MVKSFFNAARDGENQSQLWQHAWYGLLVLYGLGILSTFHEYGVTSDEHHHVKYGQDIFNWYRHFFGDYSVFESVNTWLYGGFFDVTAYVLSLGLPLNVHDTRHLYCALIGLMGVVAAYRIGCLFGGPRAGFIAALFLILTPRYYGHAFNNTKDIPFAVFYLWSLYYLIVGLKKLPDLSVKDCAKIGVAIGLTMAIRSSGVVLFLYVGLGFGVWYVLNRDKVEVFDVKVWLKRLGVIGVVSYGVLLPFWPYLQLHPVTGLWESIGLFASFNEVHYSYFEGSYVGSDEIPWYYAPKWLLLTLPEFVLVGLVCGAGWLVMLLKDRSDGALLWGLLCFGVVFPLLYAVLSGTPLYDGLRQMLFVVPPLVVVSGVGFDRMMSLVTQGIVRVLGWSLTVCLLLFGVWEMAVLHPNEYVYFNRVFGGGLGVASEDYETDYWNHSYKQGVRWVEGNYERFVPVDRKPRIASLYPHVKEMIDGGEFDVVEPEDADFYLGNTRYDYHRAVAGECLHKIEVDGVPLLYVIRPDSSYRDDPFFDGSAKMHDRMGDVYRAKGDLGAALAAYEQTLAHLADGFRLSGFDRAGVLLKMGNAHLGLDDYDAAMQTFGRVKDQEFFAGAIANNVGFYFSQKKHYADAITWLQKAVDAAPSFYQPRVSLATTYWDLGDTVNAVAGYRDAAKLSPVDAERQFKLGNLLYKLDAFDEAHVCFERITHFHRDDVRGPYYLGLTLAAQEDHVGAQNAFEMALNIDPKHVGALQSLGTTYMYRENFEGAVHAFQRGIIQAPDQANLYVMLGLALMKAKDMRGAVEAFDHALQIDPNEATAREYQRFLHSMIDE